MIVYKKDTGEIIEVIQDDQDIDCYYANYSAEFKENLGALHLSDCPRSLDSYKIVDNILVERSDIEIYEIKRYKKVLTHEERLLILLIPSKEEIRKAETTIEILELLGEVL